LGEPNEQSHLIKSILLLLRFLFKALIEAYTFYQMALLVWLTQTETGDFDELNMTSLKHPFWQEVAHLGTH
jgi:ATP-dependent DNA helicase DinG